jgi:hypothetical protein
MVRLSMSASLVTTYGLADFDSYEHTCSRVWSVVICTLTKGTADRLGFPSSHSTNSVSIALYFAQWLLEEKDSFGHATVLGGIACMLPVSSPVAVLIHSPRCICFQCRWWKNIYGNALSRYVIGVSSVDSRSVDITGGSLLGVGCWGLWYALETPVTAWVDSGSWTGTHSRGGLSHARLNISPICYAPIDVGGCTLPSTAGGRLSMFRRCHRCTGCGPRYIYRPLVLGKTAFGSGMLSEIVWPRQCRQGDSRRVSARLCW